jgi:sensor histidine kinase YesM
MKRLFIHNPFFRLIAPFVFGIIVYMLILLVSNNLNDINQLFSNQELYVTIALTFLTFETLRLSVVTIAKLNFKLIRDKIALTIVVGVLLSLVALSLSLAAYYKWIVGFSIGTSDLVIFWVIFGFTGLLYNLLYFSNEYLFKENTLLLERERKLKEKMEMDFILFRNEINPSLLYDSLETLLASLHKRPNEAEEQIDLLADVYRYQLVNRKKELVSWAEEAKALLSLCALFNHRYDNLVTIKQDKEGLGNHHVVPGSFLIAFDSVVRNTLIAKDSPLEINLYLEGDDYLVMQHRLNDKLMLHQESLENFARLQRSYSFFSDQPFVQVKADRENYIKFPLIKVVEENFTHQPA